jgi:hypothetical protein
VNIVHIAGPEDVLLAARGMPGVTLVGYEELEPGQPGVSGYATSDAIAALEALGATVTVTMDDSAYDAHMTELASLIEADEPPIV